MFKGTMTKWPVQKLAQGKPNQLQCEQNKMSKYLVWIIYSNIYDKQLLLHITKYFSYIYIKRGM